MLCNPFVSWIVRNCIQRSSSLYFLMEEETCQSCWKSVQCKHGRCVSLAVSKKPRPSLLQGQPPPCLLQSLLAGMSFDLLVEKVSPLAFSKCFWNFICALLSSSIADEIKLQVKTNPNWEKYVHGKH